MNERGSSLLLAIKVLDDIIGRGTESDRRVFREREGGEMGYFLSSDIGREMLLLLV